MKLIFSATLAATLAMPAFAQDIAAGEKEFRKCAACHGVVAPDGTVVARGGKTGPNLYGVIGRQAGTDPDFTRYKDSIVKLGETGFTWDEESMAVYVLDPAGFLKDRLGDPGASSGMTKQNLKNPADVVAYIASLAQ